MSLSLSGALATFVDPQAVLHGDGRPGVARQVEGAARQQEQEAHQDVAHGLRLPHLWPTRERFEYPGRPTRRLPAHAESLGDLLCETWHRGVERPGEDDHRDED